MQLLLLLGIIYKQKVYIAILQAIIDKYVGLIFNKKRKMIKDFVK